MKPREIFIVSSVCVLLLNFGISIVWTPVLWSLILFGPIILIGLSDIIQKKQTIKNNFPVLGHFRYMLEAVRPEIQQYFVETDIEGTPVNRQFRSLIYQRAKNVGDTTPFGTRLDLYANGYECMAHSVYPKRFIDVEQNPRVLIGGDQCTQKYSASILNISAMSFGALSKNAVLALNKGAALGSFAHNTGEGGVSPYHLQNKGDLIWQIGTGYFGCRTKDGNFNPDAFIQSAIHENVKMIELKLSQGAKPGHGGILPASKNTVEISKIRLIEPFTDVHSPPYHSAFDSAEGLLKFVEQLRNLSGGKPVGFKLCVGVKEEFVEICDAMKRLNIYPDFIAVDGGEGGTGAAPIEFTNALGLPLRDGLAFVDSTLKELGIRSKIKIIASGKIFSAFHIARLFALGADAVNSARAMMMALGCIQALQCNTNTCPTGVTTQDKSLMRGLDVNDKSVRVFNYHKRTIQGLTELVAAMGLTHPAQLERKHILRRVGPNDLIGYDKIYPASINTSV